MCLLMFLLIYASETQRERLKIMDLSICKNDNTIPVFILLLVPVCACLYGGGEKGREERRKGKKFND